MDDETMFLCGFQRLPRYGTTNGPSTGGQPTSSKRLYNKIVKHKISSSDTLQGIALKYDSSITEIKRVNKLWSNDSMHLMDELKIPIVISTEDATQPDCSPTVENLPKIDSLVRPPLNFVADSPENSGNDEISHDFADQSMTSSTSRDYPSARDYALTLNDVKIEQVDSGSLSNVSTNSQSAYDKSGEAFGDIFERIDTNLRVTAKNVRRLEAKSTAAKYLDGCEVVQCSSRHSYKNAAFSDICLSETPTDFCGSSAFDVKTSPPGNVPKKKLKNRGRQEFVPLQDIQPRQGGESYNI